MNIPAFLSTKAFKKIIIAVGSVFVLFLLWRGLKSAFIDPAVKKATKPYVESLEASRDSTVMYIKEMNIANGIIKNALQDIDSLKSELGEAEYMHKQQVATLQGLIKKTSDQVKAKDKLIENLSTGLQVDLMKLVYKKPLIGKEKLTDSTYIEGYRYGTND